jgi:hypothetical protein
MNSCPYCRILNRPGGIQVHLPECKYFRRTARFRAHLARDEAQRFWALVIVSAAFLLLMLLTGCGSADANFASGALEPQAAGSAAADARTSIAGSLPATQSTGGVSFGQGGVAGLDQPVRPAASGGAQAGTGGAPETGGVPSNPAPDAGAPACQPGDARCWPSLPPCPTWDEACYGQRCGASLTVECAVAGGTMTFNCSAAGRCPCTPLGNGGGSLYCDGLFTYDVECPAGAQPGVPGCVESSLPGTWCCP